MPYNPGIQDISGQLIAQGVSQGMESIAAAMIERSQKREKKEKWRRTVATLQPLLDQQTGGKVRLDKDTPPEAVSEVIRFAENLERQKQEAPLRELKLENERLQQRLSMQQIDQAATDAAALQEAGQFLGNGRIALPDARAVSESFASGAPIPQPRQIGAEHGGALAAYIKRGGMDARSLATLGELAMREGQRTPAPSLSFVEDPVSGKRWATLGNQLQPSGANPQKRDEGAGVKMLEVGARRYFVGPGNQYFDEAGQPVVFPKAGANGGDAALDAFLGGAGSPTLADGGTAPAVSMSEEDRRALVWVNANPNDPRAARIKAKLGVR